MRILVVENLQANEEPWWKQYLPPRRDSDQLEIAKIPESGTGRFGTIWKLFKLYLTLGKYDVVITLQDGYATFLFSFLNRLRGGKGYKHMVHEFITRERSESLYSKAKYRFLSYSLASVNCINCSARAEIEYYRRTLKLADTRFEFIPLSTNPRFLKVETSTEGGYIFTAGRTGRDYATFIEAVRDIPMEVRIVAGRGNLDGLKIPDNVKVYYDIPQDDLILMMAAARLVVLPLQDRQISVGQSVILQAMALGKGLIITSASAVRDYIQDGVTGILVKPSDSSSMRSAIESLLDNNDLTEKIGRAARQRIESGFLPTVNIERICSILASMEQVRS